MKFPFGRVIPGLIVIFLHCVFASEVIVFDVITPDEEQDLDKREFYSITAHGLDAIVNHRLNSIADNMGFSGLTDKRLYAADDQVLPNNIAKRPFHSTSYGLFPSFDKRRLANLRNNKKLKWYIQRPMNLVGGIAPIENIEHPVNAINVGWSNGPSVVPLRTKNSGYGNRWYNLMSSLRLRGLTKRADEEVD